MADSLADRLQTTLGEGYRVTDELGGGGMSRVFVAEETDLGRRVVVKVLPPDFGAGLNVERFRREIQLAARLQHPHIVPLLSAGARDGLLFYTMPLIDGETLRARLARSGELPVPDAVRILRDIADALEYAHRNGVVHRDIKPENVLLSGHHALVTDFGVSKALSSATGEQSLTSIGVALGTPAYMSPEQATADPNTDHRTDVYALGVVAYELLAGRPPFTGMTPQQVLAAHVTEPVVPITKHRPNIPSAFAHLVMRSLEKKPADRWQTAEEIRIQLESLGTPSQGTQPISAAPLPQLVTASSGRKKVAIFAGAIAALLVLTLVAGRYFGGGDRAAASVGSARQVTNDPGVEFTPALSPDGRMLAYSGGTPFQSVIYVRQVAGGQPIRIGPGRGPSWSPDGSRLVYVSPGGVTSAPALGGQSRVLIPHSDSGFVYAPALSHDGQRLAYVRSDGSVWVAASDGSAARKLADVDEPSGVTWSPDDTRLAYVSGNGAFTWGFDQFANIAPSTIWVVGRDGGTPARVTTGTHLNTSPGWLDNDVLLYVSNAGGGRDIYLQRLRRDGTPAGTAHRLTTGLGVHGLTVSPDGNTLAYSNLTSSVGIWSIPVPSSGEVTAQNATQITSAAERIEAITVSPDGQWIAFDSDRAGNADIYKIRVDGSGLEQITNHPADDFRPFWSPDGRLLTFHSWRNGNRDLFIVNADGSNERMLIGTPAHQWAGRFSPDGSEIAFMEASNTPSRDAFSGLRVFAAPVAGGTPRPLAPGHMAASPIWAPDGAMVFLCEVGVCLESRSGGVRPLKLPGEPNDFIPLETGGLSPDGRAVYVRVGERANPRMHIAKVPLDGSAGSIVVRFDRPDRQSLRPEFSTDGRNFYFAIGRHEADIWVVELQRR